MSNKIYEDILPSGDYLTVGEMIVSLDRVCAMGLRDLVVKARYDGKDYKISTKDGNITAVLDEPTMGILTLRHEIEDISDKDGLFKIVLSEDGESKDVHVSCINIDSELLLLTLLSH